MVSPQTGKRLLGWSRRLSLLEGAKSSDYWSKPKCSTCTIALLRYSGYPYSFDLTRHSRGIKREAERPKDNSLFKARIIQET
jgi:hypothetical protein